MQPETLICQDIDLLGISESQVSALFLVWLAGMFFSLMLFTAMYCLFFWQASKALPLGTYQNRAIFLNEHIPGPATISFFKPGIHLPVSFSLQDKKLLKHFLVHEMVHVKRHDNFLKFLALVAFSLHWLNPLVWCLVIFLNKDLELSCDVQAVKILGEENRAGYAPQTLLQVAQKHAQINWAALVFVSFGNGFLKERVVNIMTKKTSVTLSLVLAIVFSFSLFTVFAAPPQNNLTFAAAKEIALQQVGSGYVDKAELDYEKDALVYEIDIISQGTKYEIKIAAIDGHIVKYTQKVHLSAAFRNKANLIGEDEAVKIALASVGGGSVIKLEEDYENRNFYYDVTVLTETNKYELEIDAANGRIISSTQKKYPALRQNTALLNQSEAEQIALKKVGAGRVVKSKLDYDNSKPEYEITIIAGALKHELEIDAVKGKIKKHEQKPVQIFKIARTSELLTPERAVAIVEEQIGKGILVKCELDYESAWARAVYEIELLSGREKYEYELDAKTGQILKYEIDYYYND